MRPFPTELPPRIRRRPAASSPSVGTDGPAGSPHVVAVAPGADTDLRCTCGSLLGRFVETGLEMKCRRCKRCVVTASEGGPQARPRAPRAGAPGVMTRVVGDQIRCTCGSLLAKTEAELLWLRCRHCKREPRVGARSGPWTQKWVTR